MKSFYIPYSGTNPAAVKINGHKLLILSTQRSSIEEDLPSVGADQVRSITIGDSVEDQQVALDALARTIEGGIVVTHDDIPLSDIIKNLELNLPWVH